MAWALPTPDLNLLPLSLPPVPAAISLQGDTTRGPVALRRVVEELRAFVDDAEQRFVANSQSLYVQSSKLFAVFTVAEADGWNIDVDGAEAAFRASLHDVTAEKDAILPSLRKVMRVWERRPTLELSEFRREYNRLAGLFRSTEAEFHDQLAKFDTVRKRVRDRPEAGLFMTRAAKAYGDAIREITGITIEPSPFVDGRDGGPAFLCFKLPVNVEASRNIDGLVELDARIHDLVEARDPNLVGRVVLDFAVQS